MGRMEQIKVASTVRSEHLLDRLTSQSWDDDYDQGWSGYPKTLTPAPASPALSTARRASLCNR